MEDQPITYKVNRGDWKARSNMKTIDTCLKRGFGLEAALIYSGMKIVCLTEAEKEKARNARNQPRASDPISGDV